MNLKNIVNKLFHTFPLFLVFVVLYLLFRNFFSGFLDYPDFFQIFPAVANTTGLSGYLSAWNFGYMGTVNILSLPDYAIFSILSVIGLFGTTLEVLTLFTFLLTAVFFIYRLVGIFSSNPWAKLLASLVYLLSPVLFIEIFNGSANLIFYALLPAYLYFGLNTIVFLRLKHAFFFGIALAFGIFFNPFSLIFVLPVIIILIVISISSNKHLFEVLKSLRNVTLILAVAVLLNIPYFFSYLFNNNLFQTLGAVPISEGPLMVYLYSWANPLIAVTTLGGSLFPRYSMFYSFPNQMTLLVLPFASLISFFISAKSQQIKLLRLTSGLLIIVSFSLIELGHYGYLEILFDRLPFLFTDNYPDSFTLILILGYSLLIPSFLIFEGKSSEQVSKSSLSLNKNHFCICRSIFIRTVFFIVVLVLLLIPAGMYMTDGNFNQKYIDQNTGFPPQWTVASPSSFNQMYAFLKNNGGLNGERPLILPYPGFNGGQNFRGFDAFLFDQPYDPLPANGTNLINLGSNNGGYFATEIANDIIDNNTNLIGVPLGYASVKYVIIDKQLNFSMSPTWYFDSLIGNPHYFFDFFKYQSDMKLVFNNSVIAVFQNENFRPYVQGYKYDGVIESSDTVAPNPTNLDLSLNNSGEEWGLNSAYGVVNYSTSSNGYTLNSSSYGNMSIIFGKNGGNEISVIQNGGRYPTYLLSKSFQVYPLTFAFKIGITNLPQYVSNVYVTISGYNSTGGLIWQQPHYPTTGKQNQIISFSFNPKQINNATTTFRVILSLPMTQVHKIFKIRYTNLTLAVNPPEPMGAPLLTTIPYRLFPNNISGQIFPVINAGNSLNMSNYNNQNTIYRIYINKNSSSNLNSSNSYYLYNLADYYSGLLGSNISLINTPESIYNSSLELEKHATMNLKNFSGYHTINDVGVYGQGVGKVILTLERKNTTMNVSINFDTSTYGLAMATLQNGNYSVKKLSVQGNLVTTTIVMAEMNLNSTITYDGTETNVSMLSESYSNFEFNITNTTHFIYLSQSYSPYWNLILHNLVFDPINNPLYGNLFILNNITEVNGFYAASITFSLQPQRTFLVALQISFWAAIAPIAFFFRKRNRDRVASGGYCK